jgi:hypothetical protein
MAEKIIRPTGLDVKARVFLHSEKKHMTLAIILFMLVLGGFLLFGYSMSTTGSVDKNNDIARPGKIRQKGEA